MKKKNQCLIHFYVSVFMRDFNLPMKVIIENTLDGSGCKK